MFGKDATFPIIRSAICSGKKCNMKINASFPGKHFTGTLLIDIKDFSHTLHFDFFSIIFQSQHQLTL